MNLSFFYQIKNNIKNLDLDHPGILDSLSWADSFFDICIDYLKIYNYSINNRINFETIDYLFKLVKTHDFYKNINKIIYDSSHCRFYKNNFLEICRKQKKDSKGSTGISL